MLDRQFQHDTIR